MPIHIPSEAADIFQHLVLELNKLVGENSSPALLEILQHAQTLIEANMPIAERIVTEIVNAIFAPKLLLKQLVLAIGLQAAVFVLQWVGNIGHYAIALCSASGRKLMSLSQQLGSAKTYREWLIIAEQIDSVTSM